MTRLRWWVLVAVAVALAAFASGVVRGLTDTVPVEVTSPRDDTAP